jgi:transposase
MPKAKPPEFRRDVVAVARKREAPLNQTARDFGISEATLYNWMKAADIGDGARPGTTVVEAAEIRALKKRNRVLESGAVPIADNAWSIPTAREYTIRSPRVTRPITGAVPPASGNLSSASRIRATRTAIFKPSL